MKKETREALLKKSIDFINDNINSTSDMIPLDLLKSWMDDEPIIRKEKGGSFQYTIFLLLLMKFKESQNLEQFDLSINELQNIYGNWQTALSLVFLSNQELHSIRPFKIFNFSIYEKTMDDVLCDLAMLD